MRRKTHADKLGPKGRQINQPRAGSHKRVDLATGIHNAVDGGRCFARALEVLQHAAAKGVTATQTYGGMEASRHRGVLCA